MVRPIPTASVSALAILAALAGCGSDTDQVSSEELISRGDGICTEGRERFAEIQAQPPGNATEASDQTDELVEVATDELSELRNIRPPEELREAYDSYLEARRRALDLLEEGRDAAKEKDADAYSKAQARAAAEAPERLRLARAVGFEECSRR